jgi:hypothetical protein
MRIEAYRSGGYFVCAPKHAAPAYRHLSLACSPRPHGGCLFAAASMAHRTSKALHIELKIGAVWVGHFENHTVVHTFIPIRTRRLEGLDCVLHDLCAGVGGSRNDRDPDLVIPGV